MKRLKIYLTVIMILLIIGNIIVSCTQVREIPLNGIWNVKLQSTYIGEIVDTVNAKLSGEINLPGSLAEGGFGYPVIKPSFGYLSYSPHFIGKAVYKREINIPKGWHNKLIKLFLERVLWSSTVFVDGKKISYKDGLGVPHVHYLGKLKPGQHTLKVIVDNDMVHNIGNKGHAYTEHTQGIWNGIVGKIALQAYDEINIYKTIIDANPVNNKISLNLDIASNDTRNVLLNYKIAELNISKNVLQGKFSLDLLKGQNTFELPISVENKLKLWSEFSPIVYTIELELEGDKIYDKKILEFGYRSVSRKKNKILINNKPVFLRGNLDCVHFPLTGYPSCKLEDWIRIFKIYKSYGLNHVRFHSWTPPEAAFKAANRLGIYIQTEILWIDYWMSLKHDEKLKNRETRGYPKGLGFMPDRDQFIVDEMYRIVDYYNNHPSFIMFCIGNELGNTDFKITGNWIKEIKKKYPNILYSVSTARNITPYDDYSATHSVPNLGSSRGIRGSRTDWDFQHVYGKAEVPIIAHEIGQWPVYPDWTEIQKYRGVLKPLNLKELKKSAVKNGIYNQSKDFKRASGALNQIMYKQEIESFLRTKDCAGVQLLSMQDYQGQGEALIGWLDCFWDSKGITTPKEFRQHFNTTVPLLRIKQFVWESSDTLEAKVEISHFGENILKSICRWKVVDDKDKVFKEGSLGEIVCKTSSLTSIGKISFPLSTIHVPKHLKLVVTIDDTEFKNNWDIWVYPNDSNEEDKEDLIITRILNEEIISKLQDGEKILYVANNSENKKNSIDAYFYPLYWSMSFFQGQRNQFLGLLINESHKALNFFPTKFHSNWQWAHIFKNSKAYILNDLPESYKPIVQPIDDFHRNYKLGMIFEMKVGKGKLLVCGFDLYNSDNIVAVALKSSILKYMQSNEFNPELSVKAEWIKNFFK